VLIVISYILLQVQSYFYIPAGIFLENDVVALSNNDEPITNNDQVERSRQWPIN
jgi:hypothetical protein